MIAGLLSLGVGQSDNGETLEINRPLVIVPIAALAGFNWEWAVKMFRRIGDLFTPSDSIKWGAHIDGTSIKYNLKWVKSNQ